jgi:hypothetical protein
METFTFPEYSEPLARETSLEENTTEAPALVTVPPALLSTLPTGEFDSNMILMLDVAVAEALITLDPSK